MLLPAGNKNESVQLRESYETRLKHFNLRDTFLNISAWQLH